MPFSTAQQEIYMMINLPDLWKEWVKKYGHHSEFRAVLRQKKRQNRRHSKSAKHKRLSKKRLKKKRY